MLRKHTAHVATYFAADFEAQTDFQSRLPAVAKSISTSLGKPRWQAPLHKFFFKSEKDPLLVQVDHTRLAAQTIGYLPWADHLAAHGDLIRSALEAYAITDLTRLGFKIQAWINIGMSHPELLELFFGSFLQPRATFPKVFGDMTDGLLHLEGTSDGLTYLVVTCPQTTQQSKAVFRVLPNVKLFSTTDDDIIPEIVQMKEGINDCLLVDVDISRTTQPLSSLRDFLSSSCNKAEEFANSIVTAIKSTARP